MPPTITLQCKDSEGPPDCNDEINVSAVDQCVYWRGTQTLKLILKNPPDENVPIYDEVSLFIEPFTGPGTFTTDPAGNIMVGLLGAQACGGDTQGSVPDDDSPYKECTIEVTNTNLHTINIPDGAERKGFIDVHVACPEVGSAGIGVVECQVNPSAWRIRVMECLASN
jgi:hypothetical protein